MKRGSVPILPKAPVSNTTKRLEELLAQRIIWCARTPNIDYDAPLLAFPFGLSVIDNYLPERGLALGAIHEWFLDFHLPSQKKHHWLPPLALILGIICRPQHSEYPLRTAWIGRKCWPAPHTIAELQRDVSTWEQHHIFLDPHSKADRLWSIIEVLQSRAMSIVVADGSTLDIKATRRIQLAAQQSKTLGCLVRPLWEIASPSVARTRWKVSPLISTQDAPRWILELIRSKGGAMPHQWAIELTNHEKNPLRVLPQLGIRDSEFPQAKSFNRQLLGGS